MKQIYSNLLIDQALTEKYNALFGRLRWTEQLVVLEAVFRNIEKTHFPAQSLVGSEMDLDQPIDGVAALCSVLIPKRDDLEAQLVDWLAKGQGGSVQTLALRRAIIVNLSYRTGKIHLLYSISKKSTHSRSQIR